ncbi:MAG TPA: dihydroorotase [Epulopiscium sp.]|nr:dihydroorotase [Candidatus Epulonipiscium sp.]
MSLLIKNGRIIDPKENRDGIFDILVKDGVVAEIGENLTAEADTVIDAANQWVVPGLIDVHVHLREPGFEHKETIETGCKSAAKGGITTVCCMPNTNPSIDNPTVVEYINQKAKEFGVVNVLPVGAITIGQKGEELTDVKAMIEAGICAISDDGRSVMNAKVLKESMAHMKQFNIPMLSHCEDMTLMGGSMNLGENSKRFGLEGIGNEAEDIITARDIILAEATGIKLHLCHVSTELSLDIIRFAKARGANITAETAPHYFTLTDDRVGMEQDTFAKMSPPLRTDKDREATRRALQDGTLDIIATDHAPHHEEEKKVAFAKAPFGIVGLETSFAISYTNLVETGILTPTQLIEKMSLNPATLMGLNKGTLGKGKVADIAIIDPNVAYVIDPNNFVSKSKNTPFGGTLVKGQVKCTIVNGNIVYTHN